VHAGAATAVAHLLPPRFFDYPLKLNATTLGNLGWLEAGRLGLSYARSRISPRTPEATLEDFFINRFGDRLYRTFFKDYTEKVWGVPCDADLGRMGGAARQGPFDHLSPLAHALRQAIGRKRDLAQKGVETSLIERFLYPRLGPGSDVGGPSLNRFAPSAARSTCAIGWSASSRRSPRAPACGSGTIATGEDRRGGLRRFHLDHADSRARRTTAPADDEIRAVARGLPYRDFMTAGLVVRRMTAGLRRGPRRPACRPTTGSTSRSRTSEARAAADLQQLVARPRGGPGTVSLGLEYFCRRGRRPVVDGRSGISSSSPPRTRADRPDRPTRRARRHGGAGTQGLSRPTSASTARWARCAYLDGFENLFAVGRNGMHRYNNQDHSMLAAKAAVDCLLTGSADKRRDLVRQHGGGLSRVRERSRLRGAFRRSHGALAARDA
jgi:hypothetical protein